jgi:hypothetical protein
MNTSEGKIIINTMHTEREDLGNMDMDDGDLGDLGPGSSSSPPLRY